MEQKKSTSKEIENWHEKLKLAVEFAKAQYWKRSYVDYRGVKALTPNEFEDKMNEFLYTEES